MNDPKISIIVPVYKAENFLHKCVDSILSQTFRDIEVLLIDDGSPDNSGIICDEYAKKDNRVRVIHQENRGVSVARNRGIQEASGTYIGFVDSDDWISEDMYQTMYQELITHNCDIVICDALTVYEKGNTENDTILGLPQDCILNKETLCPELMLELAGAVWRCVYKRELIQNNCVTFPTGLKFSEDRIFNIYAMGNAQKICYIKKPLYMRYMNMDSCVNRFHPDHFKHAQMAARETEQAIRLTWNDEKEYHNAYLKQFVDASCAAVQNICSAGEGPSIWKRMDMLHEIYNDCDLQNAILNSGYYGDNGKWIQRKQLLLFYFIKTQVKQKIDNIKELYKQTGLSGVVEKCISKLNL